MRMESPGFVRVQLRYIWLFDMSSVGVAEYSIGHSQFAPPPLIEEFTILLNLYSNIKNLLDGFLETVEVVVNQSWEGQRQD